MPVEILERIIAFAIPRHISVRSVYTEKRVRHHSEYTWTEAIVTDLLSMWEWLRDLHKPPKQRKPYYWRYSWMPAWPLGLLRTSSRIRQVAGKVICGRIRFWSGLQSGSRLAKEARELWDEFRARFEGDVETSEAKTESSEDFDSEGNFIESDDEESDDDEGASSSGSAEAAG
jgi:hypothetical protein